MRIAGSAVLIAILAACGGRTARPAPGGDSPGTPTAGPAAAATAASEPGLDSVPPFRPLPLVTWGASPPGPPHEERGRTYDLVHQATHVRFDWERHAVVGTTTVRFAALDRPLATLALDAEAMKIGSVRDARGRALRHDYDGHTLRVHLARPLGAGDTATATVAYESVEPGRGAYFIDRLHMLWTQGETDYTRYWLPTYDYPNDKATWEFFVTVPRGEKALSNGRLVAVDTTRDGVVWHWSLDHPASTYLMSVVTGDYAVIHDHWNDVPVDYWVYPDSIAAGRRGFGMTPEAIGIYSRKTGVRYPWSKYDQSVAPDYIFGGMENVTATTQLDDGILHPAWAEPQEYSGGLVAHELGHQWYGDLLTTRNWANAWLNEGFATFMEQIFTEEARGRDEGDFDRLGSHEQAVRADRRARRPLVWSHWVADPFDVFFSGHIYPRGATVLQMLRHELGDSTFWAAMHRYTVEHAYGTVTSADLEKAFEDETGRSFQDFFHDWVYGAGYPAFRVSSRWTGGTLHVDAREVQPRDSMTDWFDVDVAVRALTDAGPVDGVVHVRNGSGSADLALPAPPRAVVWDPGDWLLDVTDFPRSTRMLAYQARHAERVPGRVEAIERLGERTAQAAALAAIADAATEDPFWGVRQRAVRALAAFASTGASSSADSATIADSAAAALLAASRDPDPRVRQAAAASLGHFRGDAVAATLQRLATTDSSYYVRGDAVQSLAAVAPGAALPVIHALLQQDSWLDVLRANAIYALAATDAPEVGRTLLSFLEPRHARESRNAAIESLAARASGNEALIASRLEPYLHDPDQFIREAIARALGELGQTSSIAALEAQRRVELESRVVNAIDAAIERIRR